MTGLLTSTALLATWLGAATPKPPPPPVEPPNAAALAAATEPLPTTCGPETEAAKAVARMKAAAAKPQQANEKLKARNLEADPGVRDFLDSSAEYQKESQDYRNEIHLLVEKRFNERRGLLADSYEHAIHDLENVERKERKDAIALFEEFLSRYPNDPQYSPDATFRLAELDYEKAQDDYNVAMDGYQQKAKEFQAGKSKDEPQQPAYDFGPSIQLYHRMLAAWPMYPHVDAVYYLLGYCDEQQGDQAGADQAFATLIKDFPRSRFVPEAWLRQGEYYFDAVSGDPQVALRKAAEAYLHVLQFPDQPLYDKAIYKLGWTYYRLDDYDRAVDAFVRLLDYYAAKSKGASGGDMQNEALQYTAICFADDKWGGVAKAASYFRKLGGRPYERDVYKRLGDVLYDETHNQDAVAAYRMALARAPLAPDAPEIQAKIILAYERDRAFDKQTEERDRLVADYGEGSAWYRANHDNVDAITKARDMTERALRDAAIYHIEQAIAYRKDGKVDQAFTEYKTAAAAFGQYLARYPHTKDVYELSYYYADSLYNSLQLALAAKEYELVRDMTIDHKYQREAAHDAVLAYENELEREQQAGQLAPRPVLKSTDRKGAVPTPEPLPPLYLALIHASDIFVNLYPTDPLAPAVAYKAAEGFYVFNEFDEARCRFRDLIARWPRSDVAQYAANLTIETYLATNDWAHVTSATTALLQESGGVVQKGSDLEKTLVKFQLAGIFKLAQQEMDAGHYPKAAKLFLELVQRNPQHEFADKALNNAAVCYEKTRRFDSALKIYERIVSEYPKSTLADQALFRVASDAEQSYDFNKAVSEYQLLVDRYPNSKNRASALYDAARLLEGLQRYPESARAYRRYAELFPNEPDAPQNLFRAALVFEKMKDYAGAIRAFQEFDKKFDHDKAQGELVVQARLKTAQDYGQLHNDRQRLAMLKDTVATFDRLHLGPDKAMAADAAAEAQFDLLEEQFQAYDRLKIHGSRKVLANSFKEKALAAKRMREAYLGLVRFKRPEWILAAFYRKANVLEHFANSIYDAPVPPEIKRLGDEGIALYQDQLAQKATALESQAVDDYVKTLDESRKLHIVNRWTKQTLESLNHYRPKEYPLLKEAKQELAFDVLSPEPLALSLKGFPTAPPPDDKLGGEESK
ncbi:MAG: tetratricopeptide repeat protein [Deltaproteobacteria bacterium]